MFIFIFTFMIVFPLVFMCEFTFISSCILHIFYLYLHSFYLHIHVHLCLCLYLYLHLYLYFYNCSILVCMVDIFIIHAIFPNLVKTLAQSLLVFTGSSDCVFWLLPALVLTLFEYTVTTTDCLTWCWYWNKPVFHRESWRQML